MNEFLTSLQKAYSNLNYDDFCERTGFIDSAYALDKFQTFKRGIEHLSSFDPATLSKLLNL
jgi:hypothetical protein